MRSIRSIVFTRFLVVLGTFFLLTGACLYVFTDRILSQFFVEDHSKTLGYLAYNISSNYRADLKALEKLAKVDGFTPFDAKRAAAMLEQFFEFDNVYGSVHAYRADGKLLVAKRRSTVTPYQTEASYYEKWDRSFAKTAEEVLRTGVAAATPTYKRSNGEIYQNYLVPLYDGKRAIGLLSGAVFYSTQSIRHLIEGLRLESSNFVMLTDAGGNVLAHDGVDGEDQALLLAPEIQQASKRLFSDETPRRMIEVQKARVKADGDFTLFSAPVDEVKLVLTLGASMNSVKQKRALLLKWMLAALLTGLVCCFIASAFIGNRLAMPLRELVTGVKRLEDGDFATRIDHESADELGELCSSINRLGAKIAKGRYLGHLWSSDLDRKP